MISHAISVKTIAVKCIVYVSHVLKLQCIISSGTKLNLLKIMTNSFSNLLLFVFGQLNN